MVVVGLEWQQVKSYCIYLYDKTLGSTVVKNKISNINFLLGIIHHS